MKNPKTSALKEELRENRPLPLYADDQLFFSERKLGESLLKPPGCQSLVSLRQLSQT